MDPKEFKKEIIWNAFESYYNTGCVKQKEVKPIMLEMQNNFDELMDMSSSMEIRKAIVRIHDVVSKRMTEHNYYGTKL